jgi:hypothetical protein
VPALAVLGLMLAATAWTTADGRTQLVSKRGLYRLAIAARPADSPVNVLHTWSLDVRDGAGRPVRGASITVDGDMPGHGHGLPTTPRVRERGGGRYVVQGMKFQMGGAWYVRFRIAARPGRDVARVDFVLPAA